MDLRDTSQGLTQPTAWSREDDQTDDNGQENGDEEAEQDDQPCRLLNRWLVGECYSDRTGFSVGGWMSQGFTWNPAGPVDRFNGPVVNNDRANEYQLNQLYLYAERLADREAGCISFGFRTDALYGTDAEFFHAFGLDDRIVSDDGSRFYKLAIPQLYGQVFLPLGRGLEVQIGKWYSLVGYESGMAPDDFFYSQSIGYLAVPNTNTGILLNYDLSDRLSTSHGVHRGADVWEDNNNDLGYTGMVSWTSEHEKTTVTFAIATGPEQDEGQADWQDIDGLPGPDAPGENLNRVTYSLSLELQLTEKLYYAINHDSFFQEGSNRFAIDDSEGYGLQQYILYDVCDWLTAGIRVEVYRDDDGFVAIGDRSENAAAAALYTNLTMGLNIQPRECLTLRPEIRWDWQNRDDPSETPAFEDGSSSRQFLAAINGVLQF